MDRSKLLKSDHTLEENKQNWPERPIVWAQQMTSDARQPTPLFAALSPVLFHPGGSFRLFGCAASGQSPAFCLHEHRLQRRRCDACAPWVVGRQLFQYPSGSATGRWNANNPPEKWKKTRNRWEFFQGMRSWLL